jgi:membrane-associated protease RseP (regulator of RpoE activity)
LLFYHPGVWWLSGRIRTEREHCADDVAVKVCGDAVLYAGALEMLDSRRAATGMAIGATGGSLLQRIERLMGQPRRRTPRTGAAWLTVPATLGVIAVIGIGTVPAPAVATPAPPLPPAPPAIVLQQAELPVVRESQATPEPALEPAIEVGQAEPAPDLQRPFSADAQDPIPVSPEPFRAVQPEPIPVSPAPAIVSPQAIPVTPAPPRVGTLARVLQDPIRLVTQRPGAATIPQTRVITSGQNGVYSLGGQIDGWLGLQLEDGSDRGAEVLSVVPDSPAATAGIQTGDLITGFNGTAVLGARQLARLTSETPAGRTVPLTIVRSGQEQTVEVTVAEPSTNFGWIGNDGVLVSSSAGNQFHSLEENEYFHLWNGYTDVIFPGSAGTLGVEVRTMSAELRAFFGAGPDEGILVESVQPDSIAADAGVRVGDVIVAIDGNRVDSANDLRGLTRAVLATGNAVTMTVVRDERRQDLVIEPEED